MTWWELGLIIWIGSCVGFLVVITLIHRLVPERRQRPDRVRVFVAADDFEEPFFFVERPHVPAKTDVRWDPELGTLRS